MWHLNGNSEAMNRGAEVGKKDIIHTLPGYKWNPRKHIVYCAEHQHHDIQGETKETCTYCLSLVKSIPYQVAFNDTQ